MLTSKERERERKNILFIHMYFLRFLPAALVLKRDFEKNLTSLMKHFYLIGFKFQIMDSGFCVFNIDIKTIGFTKGQSNKSLQVEDTTDGDGFH